MVKKRDQDRPPSPEEMEERVAEAKRRAYAKRDSDLMLAMVQGGHVPIDVHIIDTIIDWLCRGDSYLETGYEKQRFWNEVASRYTR